MKLIYVIAIIIILSVILFNFNESKTIGGYHNLTYKTIGGMTVVNMKDNTNVINLPQQTSEHIYDFLSEMKSIKIYEII